MNSTTIMAKTRRHGGSPWAAARLRAAGGLVIACAVAMAVPGLAKAAVSATSRGCEAITRPVIDLLSSVSFTIGSIPPAGTEIYRTKTYNIEFECYMTDRFGVDLWSVPRLQMIAGFYQLNVALNAAGLSLQIVVNGDEANPWIPNRSPDMGAVSEEYELPPFYVGGSGLRKVSLVAKIVVTNPFPKPGRYVIPAQDIFKIIGTLGAGGYPSVMISNTPTRMQFVPGCIGDVSVDNLVRFNNVFAVTGFMGSLPQQQPFRVTAGINPLCPIGGLTAPATPDNDNTKFLMLLSAQFVLQGPGRIDSDGTSIILSNEDGVENGLKMQILDPGNANQPVPILPAPAPLQRADVGNFGELAGDRPAAAVHTYMASLSSDAGKELKLGKYSTQVLVRISYY